MTDKDTKDAFIGLYNALKTQLELTASAMAEIAAVRQSFQALDPTFADTFEAKRLSALQRVLPTLRQPIAYIDALILKIESD